MGNATGGSLADLLLLPGNPGMSALGHRIEGVEPTDVGAVAAVGRRPGS